jgi:RNA polymerase sigma-70 factor (ECF subfamily)
MRTLDADTAHEAAISALHTIWTKNIPAPATRAEELRLQALTYRVLDGQVRNAQRARARRERLMDAVTEHHLTNSPPVPDVADVVDGDASDDGATDLLDRLSEREREVVVLLLDGFRVAEIAAILNSSPGAVSMRLRRARKRLAHLVEGR